MAGNNKMFEDEEDAGAPEWMVTFSDCMTLLLTFFVLLLSFSSLDKNAVNELKNMIGSGRPSVSTDTGGDKTAVSATHNIVPVKKIDQGSKTPTLDDVSLGNLSKQKRLTDFRHQKVFAVDSEKIFVAGGTVLHPDGRKILDKMAIFIKAMPSRIVVCEFDPKSGSAADLKSVNRAWAVMNYFIKQKISIEHLSITGSSMLNRNDNSGKRQVVITLLERNVYE